MASYPTDLRYTDKHEWVRTDEKLVTLGITEFAAEQLGAVTFAEMPYAGELYKPGALVGRMSGASGSKAINMPFLGQINSINQGLSDSPGLVSDDPYGKGWFVRIEPGDLAEVDALMDAAAYEAFVSEQGD